MKKIVIILMLCVAGMATHAQSIVRDLKSPPASGTNLTDTVTNTGTVLMSSVSIPDGASNVTVTGTFTKLTGTVAGVASLLGSLNGIDWTSASVTTYTVTDVASATTSWILTNKPFTYFRVSVVGSGTSTYTVKGQVMTLTQK